MTISHENGVIILTAADKYYLYSHNIYTKTVYLSIDDSPKNWIEIPEKMFLKKYLMMEVVQNGHN